jgi:prepilin-type N-terminal cleavage/methylation domain-containing protein
MRCLTKTRSQSGFTLLELMVAVVVIVVAFFGLLLSLHYGNVLNQTAREMESAHFAARKALEALKAYDFAFIYRSFNEDITDDPNGPGTAEVMFPPLNISIAQGAGQPDLTAKGDGIGNNFVVEGLRPRPNDPDGVVGTILFPEATDATGKVVLSELGQDPFLGPPRDMNGNGTTNDIDVGPNYIMLPVSVLVQWQGVFGEERQVRLDTVLHSKLR